MPMTPSDPMHVLPAAVEAAQRTASEIVADAIRAAEAAGYERGLREAREASPQAPPDKLRALLAQAAEVLGEAEETVSGIDGYCDDLTVTAKRGGDTITVPETGDSFDTVEEFLSSYGGADLVYVDDATVDSDAVREASQEALAAMHRLSGVLSEIRALLGVKVDEESEDTDEVDEESEDTDEEPGLRVGSAFMVGGPTEKG